LSANLNPETDAQTPAEKPARPVWQLLNRFFWLALLVAILTWWWWGKSWTQILSSLANIALLAGGLTLVVFIHELGHFLAAKLYDVHVETFSVGFGPPIPGLWFRKGETLYKIAWLPLGGYVKMLGENPYDQETESARDDPRAYHNKPVGQRMVIISAGVFMNLVLGAVCFIYAYMAGKTEVLPVIGYVEPGSRADQAGLVPGALILQVNGNMRPAFEDLMYASATARADITEIYLRWQTPDGQVRDAAITPRKLPHDPRPLLGLGPMPGLALARLALDEGGPVLPNTPAAGRGFRPGDVLLGVKNLRDDKKCSFLTAEEYRSGDRMRRVEALRLADRILYQWRSDRIAFLVWNPETNDQRWIEVEPHPVRWFGLPLQLGPIVSVNPVTARACTGEEKLQPGDVIVAVDGQPVGDPFRLPEDMEARAGQTVRLTVQRHDRQLDISVQPQADVPSWWNYAPSRPLAPWPIPALGITCRVEPVLAEDLDTQRFSVRVRDADTNEPTILHRGDTCVQVELQDRSPRSSTGWRTVTYRFSEDETARDSVAWPYLFWALQGGSLNPEIVLTIRTPQGSQRRVRLEAQPMHDWFQPERGLIRDREKVIYYAPDPLRALILGLRDTHRTVVNIYLTLRNLFTRDISITLLSGPAGIVGMGYEMASLGFNHFVWFLGLLSINLAVINFLPIPILDGGHMVFLIVEKIRGRPVSRRVLEYANIIGLTLLLLLFITATTMDITRFLGR